MNIADPVRKTSISREDLIAAALRLVGPHRSLSSLSLREVAREAGIAPNSFYRQFRDINELAVALIDLAGESLRGIIGAARHRLGTDRSVARGSVEAFMEQLRQDKLLHVLLREGTVGSDAYRRAVDRELNAFEDELRVDLIRLAARDGIALGDPTLAAKAITRLVFAIGGSVLDQPRDKDLEVINQLTGMVRLILRGAQNPVSGGEPAAAGRRENQSGNPEEKPSRMV